MYVRKPLDKLQENLFCRCVNRAKRFQLKENLSNVGPAKCTTKWFNLWLHPNSGLPKILEYVKQVVGNRIKRIREGQKNLCV